MPQVLLVSWMAWLGASCNQGAPSATSAGNAAAISGASQTGTILRIVCDLPAEIDIGSRIVHGNIGWSVKDAATGNAVTNGRGIDLDLGKPKTEIELDTLVPTGEKLLIRFTVTSAAEKSRFTSGEWFTRMEANTETQKVLTVKLSRFEKLKKRVVP